MTLIDNTLKAIEEQGKKAPNLDILPLTDPDTYDVFSRGDTDGVFQVESSGMRQYLRMLRPNCFEDIIAMLALYRPGPLGSGMVDEFIKRKHGEVDVTYPLPSLEGCLKDTYGVIVYQEQVMQIAQIGRRVYPRRRRPAPASDGEEKRRSHGQRTNPFRGRCRQEWHQ